MAVVLGNTGSVVWATGANATLAGTGTTVGTAVQSFDLNLEGDELDTTVFGNTGAMTAIPGLQGWTFSFKALLYTPVHGSSGLVTLGSYTGLTNAIVNLNAWDMTITRDEIECTLFNSSSAPSFRSYIPGLFKGAGSFSGFLDGTNPIVMPSSNTNEPAAAVFKIHEDTTTDNTLSCSIITTRAAARSAPTTANTLSYNYRVSGDITQSTPTAPARGILPAGALASTAADTITLTASTGRTFSGTAFWTSIGISVKMGQLVEVNVSGRGTSTLTIGA